MKTDRKKSQLACFCREIRNKKNVVKIACWLSEPFIISYNPFRSMSGERGDVKTATWLTRLPSVCQDYAPKDIFNMDETGLFFRGTTRKTFHFKGDECAGGKMSKERITVAICASMTGEKVKLLVIGKSRKPRSFKNINIKSLPVDYYYNKKAWMNGAVYEDFLQKLNQKMKAKKETSCYSWTMPRLIPNR